MAVIWTDKQKDVINTRNRNILVSAAAGSGKTAVLVERIIQKIFDTDNPVDVDRMLVVTFTKAAASEMRERVLEALDKACEANPDNEHLQRQQSYIHNASITTIDSFCAKIVREHFDKIDLDPNCRIADEGQIKMLQSDVIADMLEEYFAGDDEEFFILADKYVDPKRRNALEDLISDLYKAAVSHLNPTKWLNECRENYNISNAHEAQNSLWMKKLNSITQNTINGFIAELNEACDICMSDDGPLKYYDYMAQMKYRLENIDLGETYNKIRNSLVNIVFERIPSIRKGECDGKKQEKVKDIKNNIAAELKKFIEKYYSQSQEEMISDIIESRVSVNKLIDLTIDFYVRFKRAKEEKGIMDFNDQEHYALSILTCEDKEGNIVPSDTAREIASQYEEVMIDEYQDSNYIQEAILTSVSKGQGISNVFMVGDVKQSIYKFRLANPNLFIEKYDTYIEDLNDEHCKIILDRNFRSRKEIIHSVNYVFKNILQREIGGIEYEDGNELVYGADYYPELPEGQDNRTELLLINEQGNEMEAAAVADRIIELVNPDNGFKVTNKDGSFRTPKYKDIVILMRSIKSKADEYVKILESKGVPAYCESKTGYYDAKEVRTIIDFLSVVDNPLQDIPFAALMKSEIFGFTSQELAQIKVENHLNYFYDRAKAYTVSGTDENLKIKVSNMLEKIDAYREMVPYTSVYDMITTILESTGYDNYILALPSGIRRIRNIEILKEKAISYDAGTYKGLFNFIRYIGKIKELGLDEGEASPVNEKDNIVRIMTIHKSKGLQFPIVFVSGLGSKFSNQDMMEKIAIHEEYGIGVDFIDDNYKVKKNTIIKNVINRVKKEENYAEYLRFLYVALTRAQEKMILTAADKSMEKKVALWLAYKDSEDLRVSYNKIMNSSTFADWIGYAVVKNIGFDDVSRVFEDSVNITNPAYFEQSDIVAKWIEPDSIVLNDAIYGIDNENKKEMLLCWDNNVVYDEELKNQITRNLKWEYKHADDFSIPAKMSVTEIKKMSMSYEEEIDGEMLVKQVAQIVPQLMKEDEQNVSQIKGAERGTAYHKVFENFDFMIEPTEENMKAMLEQLAECGKIDTLTADVVNIKDLQVFACSDLAKRMKEANKNNKLYRERQFIMGIPANEIREYYNSTEMILIQGIIDVCFEENGKMIIADYKTDNVDCMEQLVQRYKVQLESYKEAIERLEAKEVSEMIIYSVKLGKEVKI